jgi:HPt (histidine-containing phosphotransfer) domain-containing protein
MTLPQRAPIVSEFADEPEMLELIGFFVAEMPGWVGRLQAAWEGQELEALRRLTHQLKGAAGGYGFGLIGDTAAEIEDRLEADEPEGLEEIRELVESLVDLCRRASAA